MDTPEKKLLHRNRIQVRWCDMDALGHVNNAVYFSYCEQTRVNWLAEIGWGASLTGRSRTGPVVVNAACDFLKPVVYPAELEVTLYGGAPGRSSFESFYEIRDCGGETLYVTGRARIVWVDFEANRSVELPEDIRPRLPRT